MSTFVALLRGVNVGKAKRLPMVELRALLTELGYTGVATLLNSGNAVFHSTTGSAVKHAEAIAAAISSKLDLQVPIIVKSAKDLHSIVSENPLAETAVNHSHLLVVFAQDSKALSELASIASLVKPPDQLVVGKSAAYLDFANGILGSKAGESLLSKTSKSVTTRNWATVLKLLALASEPNA